MDLIHQLNDLKDRALKEFQKISDSDFLWQLEKKYLGRHGELAGLVKEIKKIASEQKPVIGQLINEVKEIMQVALSEAKAALSDGPKAGSAAARFDATLPGAKPLVGRLHPITQLRWQIEDLFRSLGFGVVDGPELESEWYNFEALNIPAWHPARDSQDTFYLKKPNYELRITNYEKNFPPKADQPTAEKFKIQNSKQNQLVLRTQTSNVQVRAMEEYSAPLRIIVPGRVYRNEATDARHENTFWQVEGLMIDRDISVTHLKGTMDYVIKELLGAKTRWRPGYFPFTEPSLEMDIECLLCRSKGCRVCKHTGWLEFMGSGLVHPNVIKAGGLDPDKWSGFAFGMGPERLHMLKYGVNDIRLYKSGDLRFLEQF